MVVVMDPMQIVEQVLPSMTPEQKHALVHLLIKDEVPEPPPIKEKVLSPCEKAGHKFKKSHDVKGGWFQGNVLYQKPSFVYICEKCGKTRNVK